MRSLLLLLLTHSATAVLKGTQFQHHTIPTRTLKKEDEDIRDEVIKITFPPTNKPTDSPTYAPSYYPTVSPSLDPTSPPSMLPTSEPSEETASELPSIEWSEVPSTAPSIGASNEPSGRVTDAHSSVTNKPSESTLVTSSDPTLAPVKSPTLGPVYGTSSPVESPSASFTLNDVSTSAPTESSENNGSTIVPLQPFRVDFVSTIRHDETNNIDNNRNLRSSLVVNKLRQLEFFETDQDSEIIGIISNHLAIHLAASFGNIQQVNLEIVDKVESVFGKMGDDEQESESEIEYVDRKKGEERNLRPELSLVLVSYTLHGLVILGDSTFTSVDSLQKSVLHSFTGHNEQTSLLASLAASNDTVLRSITDVDATQIISFAYPDEDQLQSSPTNDENHSSQQPLQNNNHVNILFPTLIGLAFLSTLSAIGFLIHRKYNHTHNNNSQYSPNQVRKLNNNTNVYNHFESPESSITENVSPTSQHATTSARVHTYNHSQSVSSSEDERGWSTGSTSTDVLDWNAPVDEHLSGRNNNAHGMPYDEQTRMELRMIQMGSTGAFDSREVHSSSALRNLPSSAVGADDVNQSQMTDDNATLDGLYSVNDSYFDTGTATKSRNRRCDVNTSIDTSLNTSIDDASAAADPSISGTGAFEPGWEQQVNFEGILKVMDETDLVTDVTKRLMRKNNFEEDVTPVIKNKKHHAPVSDKDLNSYQTPKTTRSSKQPAHQQQFQKSKNRDQEVQDDEPSPPNYLTSKRQQHSNSYKSIYTAAKDPIAISKSNISAGIFTQETLGMINRNRLKSTPPPSENDYDEEMVNDAKVNALLGEWGMDSEAEEEEDNLFGGVDESMDRTSG